MSQKDNFEDSNDGWDDSDNTSEVECDRCGNIARCKHTEDPYIAEVHPEEENWCDWWCFTCWDIRHSDI